MLSNIFHKGKVNFEFCDAKNWLTNNRKTHITRYLKKQRQSDNEVWSVKGTLMQIWKYPYRFAFIWKQYPESFAFLILRTRELFAREVCKFLQK